MSPAVLILVYCVLAVLASLVGGWIPSLFKPTHLVKQLAMSLVSGVILGVALLHMLPHSLEYLRSVSWVGGSMLCGILVMFFLLRVFHVHSHDSAHVHHHEHEHHQEEDERRTMEHFSWAGLFVGLTIHSLLDGVALAASVVAEANQDDPGTMLLGLGTFLAVFLHKPLDALAITSLMRTADWSDRSRNIVNFLFALTCPLGAFLFWLGASQMVLGQEGQNACVGIALAFSAGFFLCIALSDLLPEVAFHSHDRVKLSVALLVGVALAIGVEMSHTHEHQKTDGHSDHQGHNHSHDH